MDVEPSNSAQVFAWCVVHHPHPPPTWVVHGRYFVPVAMMRRFAASFVLDGGEEPQLNFAALDIAASEAGGDDAQEGVNDTSSEDVSSIPRQLCLTRHQMTMMTA